MTNWLKINQIAGMCYYLRVMAMKTPYLDYDRDRKSKELQADLAKKLQAAWIRCVRKKAAGDNSYAAFRIKMGDWW